VSHAQRVVRGVDGDLAMGRIVAEVERGLIGAVDPAGRDQGDARVGQVRLERRPRWWLA
jgi:hypothetical protein